MPGTPQEAAPTLNTCGDSGLKYTGIGTSSERRSVLVRPGTSTKKSSSTSCSPGAWTSMKPPAPRPVSGLSVTNEVKTAATAASTALPPSRRTAAPASAVSGCPAATAPRVLMGRD